MPRALVDTTVLFAAAYRRDGAHEDGLSILQGIDTAALPEAVVLEYVLAETLNGLILPAITSWKYSALRGVEILQGIIAGSMTTHAGHEAATDFLDRIEENTRFHVESITADEFATAKALFRQYERFSFVDAAIVAYMQAEGLGYLYAFDDDFDAGADVYRLDSATNPYRPE